MNLKPSTDSGLLTKEQIETIRLWLDRRAMLDKEMSMLCDMAERSLGPSDEAAKAALWDRWEPWIRQNFKDFDAAVTTATQQRPIPPCAWEDSGA
jgi:hypothetical protein